MMNNYELQSLRKLLMLDVTEAAQYVGGVSTRSWQYWESGRYKIPADVISLMRELIHQRKILLNQVKAECENALSHKKTCELKYYSNFSSFSENNENSTIVSWRIHQSVIASIIADFDVKLV